MLPAKIPLLLAALPFSFASHTCTTANAVAWPKTSDSSSTSSDVCASACGNNSACLEACYAEEEAGQCNSAGCNDGDSDSNDGDNSGLIKKLKQRATTFIGPESATCYLYTDGSLLCLDLSTGDYTRNDGGSGDTETGEYTAPDGEMSTVLAGQSVTQSRTGTASTHTGSHAGSKATSVETSSAAAPTPLAAEASTTLASSTIPTAAVAAVTSKAGAEMLRAGAAVGALGWIVGLVFVKWLNDGDNAYMGLDFGRL